MAIVDLEVASQVKIVCILSRFVGKSLRQNMASHGWSFSTRLVVYAISSQIGPIAYAIWGATKCSSSLFNILIQGITFPLKMCFLSN